MAKRFSTTMMRALGRAGPAPDVQPGDRNVIEKMAEAIYPNGWTVHMLGTHAQRAAADES